MRHRKRQPPPMGKVVTFGSTFKQNQQGSPHTTAQEQEREVLHRYLNLADVALDGQQSGGNPAPPPTQTPPKAA